MTRAARLALAGILLLASRGTGAHACACCSDFGQRHVAAIPLDSYRREQIEGVRFADKAELFTGEADEVPGVEPGAALQTGGASQLRLSAAHRNGRWTLNLEGHEGRMGTLAFDLPETVSVFEIDPRDQEHLKGTGKGPRLYKEWKLTSKLLATGIFAPSMASGQRITLILHGYGNSCTSTEDFEHWTIVLHGPKPQVTLFGDLVRAGTREGGSPPPRP